MRLKLLEFINENENWKELLQEKPFSISIKESDDYILLMYSMIDSDFSLELVRECRGIILRKHDLKPVCIPFFKFFNAQEGHAAEIDWSSARVQEKLDGSIIKVWCDNSMWHVSTNGTIDARDAELQASLGNIRNYYDLFISADNISDRLFERLDTNKTYIFEIISPFNKIVVPYTRTEAYHIGTRDNTTLEESNEYIGVYKPNEFELYTLEECLRASENLPFSEEGYVVTDKHYNRIKVKGLQYVAAHHLRGNGTVTYSRILEMIKLNGQDDFISIFPEYRDSFVEVENKLVDFIDTVEEDWISLQSSGLLFQERTNSESRKNIASFVTKTKCPSALFSLVDNKVSTVKEFVFSQQNDKILKWIGVE